MTILDLIGKLYKYESVKTAKNFIRPLKHLALGKNGVYLVMDEVERLEKGAENVRTIFDIGAASGEYTMHFLRKFPQSTAYCFEPLDDQFKKLQWRTHRYESRVKLFNFGFYNKEDRLTFHKAPYQDASSLIDRKLAGSMVTQVHVRRLDDFVGEHGIQRIDFMKLDVEGVEKEVIEGGAHTFKNVVRNLFVEIQPAFKGYDKPDYIEVFRFLHDSGFGLVGVYEDFFFSKLVR